MIEQYSNAAVPCQLKAGEEHWIVEQFTDGNIQKTLTIPADAVLHYLIVVTDTASVIIHCTLSGEKSKAHIYAVCLGTDKADVSLELHSHLEANFVETQIHILTFMGSNWIARIDGWVHIHENIRGVAGHLLEEIIILDNEARLKTVPRLNVASNDVRASHGARIEKINEKKLFYMMSKGISRIDAKKLMIEWYFNTLFSSFEAVDETLGALKQSLLERIIY